MIKLIVGVMILGGTSGLAQAQAVKSTVVASNGVEVTVYSDDFANRKEFTAPSVKVPDGTILVAALNRNGTKGVVGLTGYFVYSGDWRRYNSALFKGGDVATFRSTGRNVGRCSSSRYSRPSCILTESFGIDLTPAEIKAHEAAGILAVQVRAEDTSTAVFEIPLAYIKAVAEVAQINIEPPVPVVVPAPAPPVEAQGTKPARATARRSAAPAKRNR